MESLSQASREIMWNIQPAWIMYVLFLIALAIFSFGVYRHVRQLLRGKPDGGRFSDYGQRVLRLIKEILLQQRVRRSRFPGIFHSFIFYSFGVLILTTAVVAFDYDFGTNLFKGFLYLLLSVGAELAGVFILIGVGMAAWRRYIRKPETLPTVWLDGWALGLITLMIVTGFLVEALRIASLDDPWMRLTPVGWLLSLPFTGLSEGTRGTLHAVLWWTHTVAGMGWIASIPFTKFFHLLALPANVFFAKLTPNGALARIDIEALMSSEDFDEESFNVGIERSTDFTWKQRLDFASCISCGRCEEICPAVMSGQPFSPREFIAKMKGAVAETEESLARLRTQPEAKSLGSAAADVAPVLVGGALDEEYIWHCRTCMACMEVCPACVEHVDTLIDVRRNEAIMQGRLPADAVRALKMLERLGNPFGPQDERISWIENLGIRVVEPGESCDVIYWIGCCTTFDPTKQKIAQDLCLLMKRCGVEFGVLGSDERCCGDPARLLGQEHIFQSIAKEQVEELHKRDFKVLLVSCPHCYNVLKNEYPQFGGDFTVVHYSEFMHEMLWSGTLAPKSGEQSRMVYHDPCYLGRYQKIYDSPREVIRAVPGAELVEMKNHRDRSLCCGGGGGHFWMDIKKGERINNLRIKQAREAGADTIVTSCAYCMQMLTDSVKLMDLEEDMRIVDLGSLVLDSLQD
jgi:Fe-S oxidoreductase/nitrate reductase gamma subunit